MRNLWQKAEGDKSLVVSLLPGSYERLASRNPRILCQKYMGAHVAHTSLECQRYKKRDEKLDSRAVEKQAKKSVSSVFAKILKKSSN
jgi:hypothetical protein